MTIIARRLTIMTLLMAIFAISFAALVNSRDAASQANFGVWAPCNAHCIATL